MGEFGNMSRAALPDGQLYSTSRLTLQACFLHLREGRCAFAVDRWPRILNSAVQRRYLTGLGDNNLKISAIFDNVVIRFDAAQRRRVDRPRDDPSCCAAVTAGMKCGHSARCEPGTARSKDLQPVRPGNGCGGRLCGILRYGRRRGRKQFRFTLAPYCRRRRPCWHARGAGACPPDRQADHSVQR